MRSEVGGIDRQGLIFVFQVKIALQVPAINRMYCRSIAAIGFDLDIPPPFLDVVQPAIPDRVVEPGKVRGR